MRILKQLVQIGTSREIDCNLDCQDFVYDLHMSVTSLHSSPWLVMWSQHEFMMNFMPLCRETRGWVQKLNCHWFSYESHSIESQLTNQACNKVRRVTQTLQLISTAIILVFLWITLGRVIKTLQPSYTLPHIPSHCDQYQETTKEMKKEERNREMSKKIEK
jgi:hypothetical protein